jgi:hypothetical protein
MTFDDLIAIVRMIENEREVWLINKTFNGLSNQNFRLNRKNNLIIYSDEFQIEISIEEKFEANCLTSFAKIEKITEMFTDTPLVKRELYTSPGKSQKPSIIL